MNGARGVIAVVGIMLLAGCTGGSDPATPSGSTAPATTAIASPAPTVPVQAATPESAVEFVKYFWALYNYAYATYDTKPLEAISDPECKYCASTLEDVAQVAKPGTRIDGYESVVTGTTSTPVQDKQIVVIANVKQAPGFYYRADGTRKSLEGMKASPFSIGLKWGDEGWIVRGVTQTKVGS